MTPTLGEEQRENTQRLNSCVFFVVVFFIANFHTNSGSLQKKPQIFYVNY